MNKDEMGLGTSKEGFLEAAALKEERNPAPDSHIRRPWPSGESLAGPSVESLI